jgi:hypothetical protein
MMTRHVIPSVNAVRHDPLSTPEDVTPGRRSCEHEARFEGNLAEVVAHEIALFNSVQAMGIPGHL